MKKNLLLYILLFFLIIVNGFFLYNYIGKSNTYKEKGRQDPMGFIIKKLKFDDVQLEKMELINEEHHHTMMLINDSARELKGELFNKLSDATIDKKVVDSITSLIGQKEKEKEAEAFYHFKSIQELCNDKQKEKFNKILIDALRKGDHRNQKPLGLDGANGHRPPPREPDGHRPPPKD